jgi:hypothetical protein
LIGAGLLISITLFLIGKYYQLELYRKLGIELPSIALIDIKFFEPKKMLDNVFTGHNFIIFNNNTRESIIIIFQLFLPLLGFLFIDKINNDKYTENFIKKFIIYNTLFVSIALMYLELSRLIALPGVDLIQRLIINRFLNINLILLIIFMVASLARTSEISIRSLVKILLLVSLVFYIYSNEIFVYSILISGSILILICSYFNNYNNNNILIKILLLVFISFPMLSNANLLRPYKFDALTSLSSGSDPLLRALSRKEKGQIILGPNVHGNSGLNVALFSGSAYYVLSDLRFNSQGSSEKVYCFQDGLDYATLEKLARDCFQQRSKEEWMSIFDQLGANMVLVPAQIKLNLELVFQNNEFALYK